MGLLTDLRSSISGLFAGSEPKRIGIYGPPNAGKCLHPDEEVLLADGTHERIEDVFEAVRESTDDTVDVSDEPHESWIESDGTVAVPALADDLSVESQSVSHVFRQAYDGSMYRVRTRLGREVTVSPEHPFICPTDDGIDPIPAEEMTTGTQVVVLSPSTSSTLDQPLADSNIASDGGITAGKSVSNPVSQQEEAQLVYDYASADVVWDEVVEIERVDHDGYIYDLTVPDHHTFATADGLVVHNTTLANRIARDWTGDAVGPESHVPHETRRARRKENVEIKRNGSSVSIDIVDTPGVATKVDYEEFLEHDIEKEDAVRRSREATEGVAEAMHWLREDVDGVIYVLDATTDPFTQVNTMLIGIIESQDLPALILANKTDLEDASVQRVSNAFPQHETIPLSALEGDNMDEVYDKIAEYFG